MCDEFRRFINEEAADPLTTDRIGITESLLNDATSSLLRGDVRRAEEAIHTHFDCSGANPLVPHSPVALDNDRASLAQMVASLLASGSEAGAAASTRHQLAMMSLATMWSSARSVRSPHMAMSAVEEALRSAHHLGDHAAVAKTLLLMFYVMQGEQGSSGDPASGASYSSAVLEDVLLRCIKRCSLLKLDGMVAEAALLVVRLRSRGPLRREGADRGADLLSSDPQDSPWTVSNVWTQLDVSLLGAASLTARIINSPSGLALSDVISSGTAAPGQPAYLRGKEPLSEAILPVDADLARLSHQACLLSADLYLRLGQLDMADFALRRALRLHSDSFSARELRQLSVKRICVRTEQVNARLLLGNRGGLFLHEAHEWCHGEPCPYDEVWKWANDVRAALVSSESTDAVGPVDEALEASLCCVRIHQCVARGQWARAVRLAQRAVDLTATGHELSDSNVADFSMSDSAAMLLGQSAASEEHLAARVLLAKVTSKINFQASQQILHEVEAVCSAVGFLQLQCEAAVVRHTLLVAGSDPSNRAISAVHLRDAIARCRRDCVTSIDIQLATHALGRMTDKTTS